MERNHLFAGMSVALACALAACQAPSAPTGATTPTPSASSSQPADEATASPAASAGPTVAPSASTAMALLSGKVYDDRGALTTMATVELTSPDRPDLKQTLTAQGGTYVVQVPAGIQVALKATQAGYTARTRTLQTTSNGSGLTPFVVDFGGEKEGMPYFLSKVLEITETTPANQAKDVSANPFEVKFKFSHPLDRDNQVKFENVLELRFQLGGATRILRYGTLYDNESATMTWSPDGTEGTFHFSAPIVTAGSTSTSVSVGLRSDFTLPELPETEARARLGGELSPKTYDAAGVSVTQKLAPFYRTPVPNAFPSDRPTAAALWGLTHQTDISFTLVSDTTKPRVVRVNGYKGLNGEKDRVDIEFDKPMRGFPTELIDPSVLKASNYRIVLGKASKQEDVTKFETANPFNDGIVTSETLTYSTGSTKIVQIPLPNGTLSGYSQIKVGVDPSVRDIAGNAIQTSTQDAKTFLADHVLIGGIN